MNKTWVPMSAEAFGEALRLGHARIVHRALSEGQPLTRPPNHSGYLNQVLMGSTPEPLKAKLLGWLLGQGLDPNEVSPHTGTPLHAWVSYALVRSNLATDALHVLLDHGADPWLFPSASNMAEAPLASAVRHPDLFSAFWSQVTPETVNRPLQHGKTLLRLAIDRLDQLGRSTVVLFDHTAERQYLTAVLEPLVARGASWDQPDDTGMTPDAWLRFLARQAACPPVLGTWCAERSAQGLAKALAEEPPSTLVMRKPRL